jgi:hypothetical protein
MRIINSYLACTAEHPALSSCWETSMYRLLLLIPILVLLSCARKEPVVQRGAYYWKTSARWTSQDSVRSQAIGLDKIYCRYFDVDVANGKILPVAPIQDITRISAHLAVTPVVYITIDALKSMDTAALPAMALKIVNMVQRMHAHTGQKLGELQIDCDWTAASRDRYFQLLKEIKQLFPGTLSATVRLHQVKFVEKTGVPPVDRGLLMFYNMGHPGLTGNRSAIIDNDIVNSYTQTLGSYPLALDYAFPLFSWGVLFRNHKMVGLIRATTGQDLRKSSILRQSSANQWDAVRSGMIGGVAIRQGDQIRLDESEPSVVLQAVRRTVAQGRFDRSTTVSFFSWDSTQMEQFGIKNMMRIYESFL